MGRWEDRHFLEPSKFPDVLERRRFEKEDDHVEASFRCSGRIHAIGWLPRGQFFIFDHEKEDLIALRTLKALGDSTNKCLSVIAALQKARGGAALTGGAVLPEGVPRAFVPLMYAAARTKNARWERARSGEPETRPAHERAHEVRTKWYDFVRHEATKAGDRFLADAYPGLASSHRDVEVGVVKSNYEPLLDLSVTPIETVDHGSPYYRNPSSSAGERVVRVDAAGVVLQPNIPFASRLYMIVTVHYTRVVNAGACLMSCGENSPPALGLDVVSKDGDMCLVDAAVPKRLDPTGFNHPMRWQLVRRRVTAHRDGDGWRVEP